MADPTNSPLKKRLEGKVAIVTGGASGLGEAAARQLADQGARAVVIADIQDERGLRVAESLGFHRCSYIHCDVADEGQVRSAVEQTVSKYGRLDVMFSNAGIVGASTDQFVLELDLSVLDRIYAVNARGMAACVKHAARAMVEGGVRGSIVCMASVMGSWGGVRRTDYVMSKHAVLGLMRSASRQLGAHGIRVNSVSPYAVATQGMCEARGAEAPEVEKIYEPYMTLKGDGLPKAENVADAVVFLASDESAFITGHDLVVDGGFLTS